MLNQTQQDYAVYNRQPGTAAQAFIDNQQSHVTPYQKPDMAFSSPFADLITIQPSTLNVPEHPNHHGNQHYQQHNQGVAYRRDPHAPIGGGFSSAQGQSNQS